MSTDAISTDRLLQKIEPEVVETTPTFFLINDRKQCHALRPVNVDPGAAVIVFQAPEGRVSLPSPDESWVLLVQERETAYRVALAGLEVGNGRLACSLAAQGEVLARRRSVRFSALSRNPVQLSFVCGDQACQASLVDFSTVGIGIWLEKNCCLAVGDTVADGVFVLRNVPVHFTSAELVHQVDLDGGYRLGFAFRELSESDRASIDEAFNACARSHSYVSSMRVDG